MSDAERVYEMVARRKDRAKALGLLKTAFDFYCELTRWYPESAKTTPGFIPESSDGLQPTLRRLPRSPGSGSHAGPDCRPHDERPPGYGSAQSSSRRGETNPGCPPGRPEPVMSG